MTNLEEKTLIFNSIFECLTAGQERYKDIFFKMLDNLSSLDELFSDEDIFNKLSQLANSKTKIDVYERFFRKIKDFSKILSFEEASTGNNLLHILFKQKVDIHIVKLVLNQVRNQSKIVNYKNKVGNSPLHFAIRYSKDFEGIEMLIDAGADIAIQNKELNTPLHESVMLLTFNRDFDLFVLEQQLVIFQKLSALYNVEMLSLTNKDGNTALHQVIDDLNCYRGTSLLNGMFTYLEFVESFQTKKTDLGKIKEFFEAQYPQGVETIISHLIKKGISLKAKNHLKISAFQMAFLRCHVPAIHSLYENGDALTPVELHSNRFSQVALKLVEKNTPNLNECLKIFIHAGGNNVLRDSQLGHAVLKKVLVEHLNLELTDLLMTEGGARFLDNGDAHEIWKTLFFKLSHCDDAAFKVTTLQLLFHIGVNYTKKDNYGRNAEDLARLYKIHDEFKHARKEFEHFAVSQIKQQSKSAAKIYDQSKAFYH